MHQRCRLSGWLHAPDLCARLGSMPRPATRAWRTRGKKLVLKTQKRYQSASVSVAYPWQSALARLAAAVLVFSCSHPTCALVLHQWRDLRRVHGALEARNESSKTQKSTILPLTRSCTPGNLSLRASPLPSWRSAARTRPVCSSWTSTAIYAGCPE